MPHQVTKDRKPTAVGWFRPILEIEGFTRLCRPPNSLVDNASASLTLALNGLGSNATGGFPHDMHADVDMATTTANRAITTRTRALHSAGARQSS